LVPLSDERIKQDEKPKVEILQRKTQGVKKQAAI
jgi:hypothetical protein